MCHVRIIPSPLGPLHAASDGESLIGLWMEGQKYFERGLPQGSRETAGDDLPVFAALRRWLDCYFTGKDPGDTPPLAPRGTPFQRQVWDLLLTIPYSATTTYGELVRRLAALTGTPASARAVGGAVGRNPVSILIPCHRVLAADGGLHGYAGGLERKRRLLALEGIHGAGW